MAVPAQKLQNKSASKRSPMQLACVKLFAAGKSRPTVAKLLAPHMFPQEYARDQKMAHRAARKKIRSWEEAQWFRDLVYDTALMELDADLPVILKGMSKRARTRVDAARLVLEVTGRHNPRGEAPTPAIVQINLGGAVPRPSNRSLGPAEGDIEGEATEDDE